MSDLVLARNCCLAIMLPGEAELVSETKSVKHFERFNGLDTALYKNYIYIYLFYLTVVTLTSIRLSFNDWHGFRAKRVTFLSIFSHHSVT